MAEKIADLRKRADRIRKVLNSRYPDAEPALFYRSAFELLVATILSAQCTDQQVNRVTPVLFERFPSPADMASAGLEEIETIIHSTGFYKNKARNIKACSQALVDRHGGEVPPEMDLLVQLPGVGRKTANVVLGAAFDVPGVVVDTHVARVSARLGLTGNTEPERIETDLMAVLPRKEWSAFSLRVIFFGREICVARKPKCPVCPINALCPYPDKTR